MSVEPRGRLQGSPPFPGFEAKRQLWCEGTPAGAGAGKAGFGSQLGLSQPGLCFFTGEMGLMAHCSLVSEGLKGITCDKVHLT